MCEFQYKFSDDYRIRVIFDTVKDKALTKCNIKEYIDNEINVNALGIAFCMPEDEWNDAEGRKWAFIDAIKHLYPHKCYAAIRKILQREYIKYEKKWEAELVDKGMDELKPPEFKIDEDYYTKLDDFKFRVVLEIPYTSSLTTKEAIKFVKDTWENIHNHGW